MGLFDKLSKAFQTAGSAGDANVLWLYVQCDHCGEVVRVRINRSTDLEHLYDENGDSTIGYALHKEVMGTRCFRLMRVETRFDSGQRMIEKDVKGGRLLTQEQAEEVLRHESPPSMLPD